MTTASEPDIFVRWMIRADVLSVLAILNEAGRDSTRDSLRDRLKSKKTVGLVAEIENTVVGVMIYDLDATVRLDDLCVAESARKQGVGRALVKRLTAKLTPLKRTVIEARVSIKNLRALRFLRGRGFVIVQTIELDEVYVLQFEKGIHSSVLKNRIAKS